ncbi:hypothetical protein EF294_06380 [Gordonia oryzae]|uniref:Uncharacterized protein n=1 Tax=Gordonia oryzae TaxID=2487349 RepID=A0A3N4GVI9_9ACTN|nr:hypothetical protein EF294_06380 [Gordonia oryzae]
MWADITAISDGFGALTRVPLPVGVAAATDAGDGCRGPPDVGACTPDPWPPVPCAPVPLTAVPFLGAADPFTGPGVAVPFLPVRLLPGPLLSALVVVWFLVPAARSARSAGDGRLGRGVGCSALVGGVSGRG